LNARGNQKKNTEPGDEPLMRSADDPAIGVEKSPAAGVRAFPASARTLNLPYVAGTAFFITLLDQLTKWGIVHSMYLHESYLLIPRILAITRIHNTGIAFGLFPGLPDVFMVVTFISIIVVLYFYLTLEHRNMWVTFGCGLILGGATGNLLDRFRLGYVVDFINFSFWPAFNVADSSVCVGVGLLIMGFFVAEKRARDHASDSV
jgi:signal peptidase II